MTTTDSVDRMPYASRFRRLVLDMQIPDWDDALLAAFDAEKIAGLLAQARIDYAMLYAQNCTGVCFWPTRAGQAHRAMRGRDFFSELVHAVRGRGIAACAYYSVVFNNLIARYPDWRVRDSRESTLEAAYGNHRFGQACPNNPDYRVRVTAEVEELLRGYRFDVMFFDMAFWRPTCLCPHCLRRYQERTGEPIPETVDWLDPRWCRYQAVREEWTGEFMAELTGLVKRTRPGLPVYHNFGGCLHNWTLAATFAQSAHSDFLGGDFYGDAVEQLLAAKLLTGLTAHRPAEFMASRCTPSVKEHTRDKPFALQEMQAFAAITCGAAISFIDGIDPRGTLDPAFYERLGRIYRRIEPYEPYLGGTPLAEVAVYFSDASRMRFSDNGKPLGEIRMGNLPFPHQQSVRGACKKLQEAHIPFTVITAKDLTDLSRYRVVVLADVLRMSAEEAAAFRQYIRAGGNLYVSRRTSLTGTDGTRHADFLLADLFGCHYRGEETGVVDYLKQVEGDRGYLSVWNDDTAGTGMTVLREEVDGTVLATRTAPYAPQWGSVVDQAWNSLHSAPPWRDTPEPVVIEHQAGAGRVIYSGANIEAIEGEDAAQYFLTLIRRLTGHTLQFAVEAHPCVWAFAYDQPDKQRLVISLLNYQAQFPVVPVSGITFRIAPPAGRRITRLYLAPEETSCPYDIGDDGAISVVMPVLELFQLFVAEYA